MALDYLVFRGIHQTAAALSFAGFFARGVGSLAGAAWVRSRPALSLPHLVDSVLLLSAIVMLAILHLTPTQAPWLMSKIAGLLLYIALGVIALRPGRPVAVRATAWVGALVVFGWIVSVAITKSPWGFFSLA